MQREDFVNFRNYYKVASAKMPKDNFYQSFLSHKVVHSADVLRQGVRILEKTPKLNQKSKEFRLVAERALLFHDVGRFEEGLLRYQAENNQEEVAASSLKFNHCDLGYNTLLADSLYNDPRILASVKFHGLMIEDVYKTPEWQQYMELPEKEEIKEILYLTRDADKLSNLWAIKRIHRIYHDIFYKQLPIELRTAPLSKQVVEQFMDGKTILFPTVKSFADRLLMNISWIYDINYFATLQICKTLGVFDYLLEELDKINQNKDLQSEIAKRIVQKLSYNENI